MKSQTKSNTSKLASSVSLPKRCAQAIRTFGVTRLVLLGLLFIVTVYSSLNASYVIVNNADAVVYPYLFEGDLSGNQIIVPDKHTNILKFPLYWLQSVLPYTFKTFALANSFLVLVTVFAWAFLLMRLFGREYHPLIIALLSLLILSSQELNNQIIYTTIRNIEYPIAFAFIVASAKVLFGSALRSRRTKLFVSGSFLLFTLTVAGDNFFQYTVSFPILLMLLVYAIRRRRIERNTIAAASYVIAASLIGLGIKLSLVAIGLIELDKGYLSSMTHTLIGDIVPAMRIATSQFMHLSGINTWGDTFSYRHAYILGSLFLAIVGAGGLLWLALRSLWVRYTLTNREVLFVSSTLAAVFFITFMAYVMSGLVVQRDAHGAVVNLYSHRYIAMMPFITILGLVYAASKLPVTYKKLNVPKVATVAVILVALCALPLAIQQNNRLRASSLAHRTSIVQLSNLLRENGITQIISGYWYAATTRFWSGDQINFAVAAECNLPSVINTRKDWYTPSPAVHKSAVIMDMSGPDLSFLGYCSAEQLVAIYGQPSYTLHSLGIQKDAKDNISLTNQPTINIWVYDYDTRSKLRPLPF